MPKKESFNRRESDEYSEGDSRHSKKRENIPRFVKNAVENIDPNQIVVNLSKTHYDVIEVVVEQLGWIAQTSKKSEKWDILWTDYHIEAHDLFKLNNYQKISHFPAIYVLAKKNFLGKSLMKMNKSFPKEYNFFPSTWSVPSQLGELMRYDAQQGEERKKIYIFKPQASSQGKGITLFQDLQDIEGKTGIVQTYITNPYLVDGLKFDMRIYVLIYGCDPMRIYIYEQGLARFATQIYQKPKKKNLKDTYVHLTNYAINKGNKNFVFNTSETNMNIGHKRSLTSIYNLLRLRGVDIKTIKDKIDSLIVKTLLVGKPMLLHMYGLSQMDNLTNDHCFHILGFDVLLDEHLQPILLEVNHTPSFATDTPLDKSIKKQLIKQTLLLLNVNVETKKRKLQKMKEFQEKRMMRKLTKLTPQEKLELKNAIEKQKDQHEAKILKKYRKLYPLQTNKYQQIEDCSQKNFNMHIGLKNIEVKQQKDDRLIFSPSRKNKLKGFRPQSFGSIQKQEKIELKDRQKGSINSSINKYYLNQSCYEKLPGLSPHKIDLVNSSVLSPIKLMKTYQFSPEKVFSQIKQKIFSQLKQRKSLKPLLRNRYDEMSLSERLKNAQIFSNTQKNERKTEQKVIPEPRLTKLKEIAVQNLNLFCQTNKKECSRQIKINNEDLIKKNQNNIVKFMMTNKEASPFQSSIKEECSFLGEGLQRRWQGSILNKQFLVESNKSECLMNDYELKQLKAKYKYKSKF